MAEQHAIDGFGSVNHGDPMAAALALPGNNPSAADAWFTLLAHRPGLFAEDSSLRDAPHDSAPQNEITPPSDGADIDPALAAVNALVDPVSFPTDSAGTQPHRAAPPGTGLNTPPPNLAGAGQGPGGASTPFAAGGGSSGGGGGTGSGFNNHLAQLGNEGAFSPQIASGPSSGSSSTSAPMQPPSSGSDFPSSAAPSPLGGFQPLSPNPPVANNDSYTLLHDSTLSVPASGGVLANDSDPNQLPLSAVLVSTTSHGNLALHSDGSFVYTANPGYTGSDTFTYYATDGQANSNTATVTLTINDPNAPVSTADSYSGLHDQVLSADASTGVLANDTDADGDTLTASLVSGPTHGTLQFNGDGSFAYTPNASYVGADSFQYHASDGVLTSAATTVNLTLTDTAPVATAHSYGTPENTTENVTAASGLLSGASDADGDALTASLVSNASHGNVTVNSDGSFTYVPTTGYTGSDNFQYKASDGAESSTATVTLTVHGTDATPTANAASYTVLHDQTLSETAAQGVLSHASDSDNDPLTASLVNGSGPTHGTLTFNNDGSFTYVPNAGYTGSDSFQYTASDGKQTSSAATVTLTVNDPNAPVAVADSYSVERNNEFDADASTGVLANDTDADGDTLTATVASQPLHGSLTLNSDGSFSYTPNSNYTGSDSFTYTASDGVQSSAAATVTLTVSASAPVANNDSYAVAENGQLLLDGPAAVANDYSPDNMALTVTQLTQPSHGTATLTNSGSITYTPTAGYVGPDSFTYDDSDGTLTSNVATINLNVKASNTAPTATNLSYTLAHDSSLSTDSSSGLLSGASDADGDALYVLLANYPTHGTLQFTPYGDGSFTYTPNAGYSGSDSFTYTVSDGISTSTPATVTLTITNDTPTANPDRYSVLATGSTSVSAANGVLANDTDGEGDTLTAVLVSQPAHGNVTLNSDGSFTFTPNGFTGTDSFTYKASDGPNTSAPVTVTLTSSPVAQPQAYGVTHDQTLSVDGTDGLLTGAVDADGDTLTASLASGASHGTVTVNSDGSFTYTPATHYTGSDSFTYTVSDGTNTSASATVTINVTDDVPQAYPQSWDTPEGTPLSVSGADGVLASSADDDGDSLTAQLASGTSNGTLQLGSDGSFTYTPKSGFFGTDSFTYDVTDGVSTSAPATITIEVNEVLPQSNNDFRAVATGDFNNDGNPDFVAANYTTNSVSVFMGNGDGTFQTPAVYNVGRGPLAVVAGNFGNGQQDLAVANSLDNTVTILMNNGSGSFTSSQVISVGTDPVSLAAGDFRGTGIEDLAVVNEGSNTISILQNNGSGVFSVVSTVTAGTTPDSVASGDLNGDGKADLVVANSGSNNISVLLSAGSDTFAAPVNYAVGSGPTSVAIADLNGDGKLDVAVANGGSNNVSVLLGNGDGTLGAAINYGAGTDPVSVAVGDFNGDGLTDLGVVNHGSNDDTELINSGGGGFLDSQRNPLGESPAAVAVADFNKDGTADQIVDQKPEVVKGTKVQDVSPKTDSLALSPGATYAAGFSKVGHVIRIWNVTTMSAIKEITLPAGITSAPMAFSPKDPNLMAVGIGGTVAVYNVQTGQTVATWKYLDGTISIRALAFSEDGTQMVVGGAKAGKGDTDGMVWQVSVDPTNHTLTKKGDGIALTGGAVLPINQILITQDAAGTTVTAVLNSGIQTWYMQKLKPGVYVANKVFGTVQEGAVKKPSAIAVSPNSGYLLVGYADGDLQLLTRQAGGGLKGKATFSGHNGAAVVGVGFNKDGLPVKVDINGISVFLDAPTLGEVKGAPINPNGVVSGVVSPTGNAVFVGSKDGSVKAYYVIEPLEQPFKVGDTPLILRS